MTRRKVDATTEQYRQALKILLGGMLGMMVAMGIGRFSFTPILPLMQRDLGMSNSVAGWLAGLNYLGYLAGAIGCSFAPALLRRRAVVGGAWLLSLATTFGMGTTLSVFWWGTLRLVGGVVSAVLFIAISAAVAEALARRGQGHRGGALYGGVGLGIAVSGLLVPPLDRCGGWSGAWLGMGVVALVLATVAALLTRNHAALSPPATCGRGGGGGMQGIWPLAAAYFLQGLGYIVTATFIVAIIAATPGLAGFASYSWVAVGLSAVPSTILWPQLARRIGARSALFAAYFLQACGILVSIRAESILAVLFVAVSFGGTFLGIVAMTLAEGRRRTADGGRAAAVLTAFFGIGQMLGPVLAGILADRQDGFAAPLLLAACCVFAGAGIIAADRRYGRQP